MLLRSARALLVFAVVASSAISCWGAETQTEIDAAEQEIKDAARLYRSKSFREAGAAVERAQQHLEAVPASTKELGARRTRLVKQLAKAHALLELEGVKLTPLKIEREQPTSSGKSAPRMDRSGKVSFMREVVPVLMTKCGECHVSGIRGRFSMGTFAAFEKGGRKGPAYVAGSSGSSRMIEMIKSGDMPRNGGKLSPEELSTLEKWIDQGAKFDGSDTAALLVNPVSQTASGPRPQLEVVTATGKEQILYSRDVGPVFMANCLGCHSKRLTLGDLQLDTFSRVLRGGASGVIVVPGKPDESLLVRKLRGLAGARMPMRRDPLPEATISKIAKWIADGARYDAYDPNQMLDEVVAMGQATRSNHQQLAKLRADMAAKNWQRMLPDSKPSTTETENFLLYGNIGPNTLVEVGQLAEKQIPKLRRILKAPAGAPFVKGRVTLYVFDKRYDYSEIGPMIEQREIPTQAKGHWRYTFVDAYGCALPPGSSDEYSLDVLLGQQIAGVHVASQGRMPRWFAEGSARAIAWRLDPKDPRVRTWDGRIAETLAASGRPEAFLSGKLPPEDADVLSFGFLKYLMANANKYHGCLASMRGGMPFDQAFQKSFGGTPSQLAAVWGARVASDRKSQRAAARAEL